MRIRVKMSFHTLKLLIKVETMPLVSKEAIVCAIFASAVGETKLALTAMVGTRGAQPGEG